MSMFRRSDSSRRLRRTALVATGGAVALLVTGCPVVDPPSTPYHPERLAPGNRIILRGPGTGGQTLANPGGLAAFPTDPVAAEDLQYDSLGYGNPGIGIPAAEDRVGSVTHPGSADTVGLYDGNGALRIDFGGLAAVAFSDDGTVMAVSRLTPTQRVDVYDTDDLTLRRSLPWSGTWPVVHDISADDSTMLVRGTDPGASSTDYPLYAVDTWGTAPMRMVLDGTGGSHLPSHVAKYQFRLTDAGRVVYASDPAGPGPIELRSMELDGTDVRNLGDGGNLDSAAGERGTGRILIQQLIPGTDQTQVVAVEDSPAATRTVIAGPLTDQSLSRVVLPA